MGHHQHRPMPTRIFVSGRLCAGAVLASVLLASFGLSAADPAAAQHAVPDRPAAPTVAGWVERVTLPGLGLALDAKLDTGAETSSIDGRAIEAFRRGATRMVRFDVVDGDGRTRRLEAAVVRRARIKRAGDEPDRRPVIALAVCVAGATIEAEFTVADRADLAYRLLIGRNVLAGRVLVDSAARHIASDRCLSPR